MNSSLLSDDATIGGGVPLLCTPYTEAGALDEAVLARQAQFVAGCCAPC